MVFKNNEELLYIIEIFGHAPEFWPVMAFRKEGTGGKKKPEHPERMKEIRCPYCGKQFMLVSQKRKLDLLRFTARTKAPCHEYRKCKLCHENIGIVYRGEKISA